VQWQHFWKSCTGNKLQAYQSNRRWVQTNLSAQLVSVHSPSSTSLLIVLIFSDTRNKHFVASSMEELFRTAEVHNISLILQKKLIFTASYDVYRHFIVAI